MRCGEEFGLELTETERLTLYDDSVEELGAVGMLSVSFFVASSRIHTRIKCVAFSLSYERKLKKR